MKDDRILVGDSDTGFRRTIDEKGNTDGRAQRGANICLKGSSPTGTPLVHIIEFTCGTIKQVVRSTFTSETHGVIMTIDTMLPIAITLHEIAEGPISKRQAMEFSEVPGLHHELEVCTDTHNLVSTLALA